MQTPEEFIMSHARPGYDPVKAHEYYLRTRQLKGRKTGSKPITNRDKILARRLGVRLGTKQSESPKQTITSKRQEEVKARVETLRDKLQVLHTILNKLVSEAQASAPAKKTTKSVATKSKSTDRKPLTGAQKREKAKKAKDKYQKEHPVSEREAKQRKIEQVRQQIEDVQAKLKDALARAREMSTKNQPALTSRRKV